MTTQTQFALEPGKPSLTSACDDVQTHQRVTQWEPAYDLPCQVPHYKTSQTTRAVDPDTGGLNGNVYLLLITDLFSRWTKAFPLHSQVTRHIINKFNQDISHIGGIHRAYSWTMVYLRCPPTYLKLFEAQKGAGNSHAGTQIKCCVASMRKVLNWRAALQLCCCKYGTLRSDTIIVLGTRLQEGSVLVPMQAGLAGDEDTLGRGEVEKRDAAELEEKDSHPVGPALFGGSGGRSNFSDMDRDGHGMHRGGYRGYRNRGRTMHGESLTLPLLECANRHLGRHCSVEGEGDPNSAELGTGVTKERYKIVRSAVALVSW
ncbi:hypothetical protein PR048_008725 [Dryococelus australis]|uniref:Integrase catalytic domain-containing protein n=1 Tax=Dryococelus australis TaxID=614101 RepID=A0ABQ9HXW7_9NEOP|nr:hypothetical protein PR048_008725 [Dryococelus australis]